MNQDNDFANKPLIRRNDNDFRMTLGGRRAEDKNPSGEAYDKKPIDLPPWWSNSKYSSMLISAAGATTAGLMGGLPEPWNWLGLMAGVGLSAYGIHRGFAPLNRLTQTLEDYAKRGGPVPTLGGKPTDYYSHVFMHASQRMINIVKFHVQDRRARMEAENRIGLTMSVLNEIADPVFWIDAQDRVNWSNDAAIELGIANGEPLPAWFNYKSAPASLVKFEVEIPDPATSVPVYYSFTGKKMDERRNNVVVYVGSNITELKRKEIEERRRSRTCPITKVLNRIAFEADIESMDAQEYGLIYIDLDKFKPVNDQMGHPAGDALLYEVSQRMSKCGGTLYRIGGDEFAVLIKDNYVGVKVCAQKLLDACLKPVSISFMTRTEKRTEVVQIGASLGCAIYPEHGKNIQAVIKRADEAMYRAKEIGRGCFVFADE